VARERGHAINYYEVPVLWSTLEVYHDLVRERYLVTGLDNARNTYRFSEGSDPASSAERAHVRGALGGDSRVGLRAASRRRAKPSGRPPRGARPRRW